MSYNYIKANTLQEILNILKEQRGLNKEELMDFVSYKSPFNDPYLLKDMDKAVSRLKQAMFDQEPICIIGDYDVDGLTATTLLYKTFVNFMPTYYLIPNRLKDGYGISKELVDRARRFNVNLLITVDNGISGQEAINYAHSLGMEVIVTDHHLALNNDFPADITINPQICDYPFKGICGCMVAYKLSTTILTELGLNYDKEEFIELTTLATIADIMPLINENRTLVHQGLKYLNNSHNIGLKTLIKKLKINEVNTNQIGFFIAPCLNAAGRMDSPDHVMNLLLSDDEFEAEKNTNVLIKLNDQRKDFQNEVMKFIQVDNSHPIIIAHIQTKISGIAGIIAAKIQSMYNKPTIAVGGNKELSGSGRSNDFPLDLLFKNCNLIEGGGHSHACGISFKKENLNEIQEIFDNIYNNYIPPEKPLIDTIFIDIKLINNELINAINTLQPFGEGNNEPLFSSIVEVESKKVVGNNQNCTQFTFIDGWNSVKGILFDLSKVQEKDKVEVIYNLQFNEFPKNVFTPQMLIQNIRAVN